MPIVQRFAQVFGAVYVLVGVVGFIPPLLIGSVPGVMGPFADSKLSHCFHTAEVAGSNPASPTLKTVQFAGKMQRLLLSTIVGELS